MTTLKKQAGFTAIELLITLFVAAGFLIASYQLFNLIIKDNGQARAESRAGNVAYEYLRRYATQATSPCLPSVAQNNSPITVDGLVNATITINITCPNYSATPNVSKIEAVINYNAPQQTVKYATYTVGTNTDILNGLVGWWRLNGSGAPDSSGNNRNGTLSGSPTTAAGQNGLADTGFQFNGTNQFITIPNVSAAITGSTGISMSGWVNAAPSHPTLAYAYFGMRNDTTSDFYVLQLANSTTLQCRYRPSNGQTYTTSFAGAVASTWQFISFVYNGSTVKCYVNGVERGSATATGTISATTTSLNIARDAINGSYLNGSVDDVRLYNRVLSLAEIQTLYAAGAK